MNNNTLFNSKTTINYLIIIVYLLVILAVYPISIGVFFAYLTFPIVQFCNRTLKIPFVIALFLISSVIFAIFAALITILFHSLLQIAPSVQEYLQSFSAADLPNSNSYLPIIIEQLSSTFDRIVIFIGSVAKQTLNSIFELLIFILTFYFSLFESRKNRLWFFAFVPASFRPAWQRYFTKTMDLFSYFFYVELQLFVLTFLLLCCGFYILQFDGAISMAFLISLADALPFIGIGLFLIPISIYFFFVGHTMLGTALIVLYIFIQLTRQLTESKLWANTLQLRTIHTFFISAASILLFGVYGILLSPIFLMLAVKVKQSSIFEQ